MEVPKGSLKLRYILDQYASVSIKGCICSDLGCNVGGFTRELLARGAARVHSIDTGYGALEWDLRNDSKVVVKERSNALHLDDITDQDIIVSDLAWTKQEKIVPRIFKYLKSGGVAFSLLKPQYEIDAKTKKVKKGVLDDDASFEVANEVIEHLDVPNDYVLKLHESPIRGGKNNRGNLEFWLAFLPKNLEV